MKFLLAILVCLVIRKGIGRTKIPPLIFYMVIGVIIGPFVMNQLEPMVLDQSNILRKLALAIILLRAGTSLEIESVKSMQSESIFLSFVPALFEAFAITSVMYFLGGFTILESLMLAFILSAVSPAVVIPAMIKIKDKKLGTNKNIPDIILGAASLDDIFVITIFTIVMNVYSGSSSSVLAMVLNIPLSIFGGIIIGYALAIMLNKLKKLFSIPKFVLPIIAFILLWVETKIPISALLAIMAFGLGVNQFEIINKGAIKKYLNNIWVVGEIVLFMLLGASIDISSLNLIGLSSVLLILFGLLFRMLGVLLSLIKSNLNLKEKRFVMLANTPKATVQAALAGIPLSYGVAKGNHILALASFSIILTAPLAAYMIEHFAPKLLTLKEQ